MGLAVVAVSCLLSLARLPTAEAYNSVQDYKFVAGGCGFALNFDGGRSDMASLVFPKKVRRHVVHGRYLAAATAPQLSLATALHLARTWTH
jgi:hypothetical protein